MNGLVPIQDLIYKMRGYKVMLDNDLAKLYGIETFNLNKAVKRNIKRFSEDFMFQLTKEEYILIFQNGISKQRHGGRRTMPYAFTEQGVAMLSSILNNPKAIEINIQIMRTFVKMRQFALENKELAQRITELERYFIEHTAENKKDLQQIYNALSLLMDRTKPTQVRFKT